MFTTTAWVWSCGSRFREVSWRKVAVTILCPPAWTIAPVALSCIRGLDAVALDPGEGARHGPVVRAHDPVVPSHQCHERNRLRSRQRDVPSRPMVDLPVLVLLAEVRAARHLAFEHGLESVRIDWTRKPERLGSLSRPRARFPSVLGRSLSSTARLESLQSQTNPFREQEERK